MQQKVAALYTALKAVFDTAYAAYVPTWEKIAMRVPSTTAVETYVWLSQMPEMRELVGERLIKKFGEYEYTLKNKTYEATIQVSRDDVEDNLLGQYSNLAQQHAGAAAILPDRLTYSLLKDGFTKKAFDGKAFFATNHANGKTTYSNFQGGSGTPWYLLTTKRPGIKPLIFQERKKPQLTAITKDDSEHVFLTNNYLFGVLSRGNAGYGLPQLAYGSKETLDKASFVAAYTEVQSFVGDTGSPLGLTPDLLVVPPTLQDAAREILFAEQISGTTNTWRNAVELLVSPLLA